MSLAAAPRPVTKPYQRPLFSVRWMQSTPTGPIGAEAMTPMSSPLSISCSRSMCIGNGIIRLQSYDLFQTWRRLRAEYVAPAAVKPCPHAAAVEPPWSRGPVSVEPLTRRHGSAVPFPWSRRRLAAAPYSPCVCGAFIVRLHRFCRTTAGARMAPLPFGPCACTLFAVRPSPFCRPSAHLPQRGLALFASHTAPFPRRDRPVSARRQTHFVA